MRKEKEKAHQAISEDQHIENKLKLRELIQERNLLLEQEGSLLEKVMASVLFPWLLQPQFHNLLSAQRVTLMKRYLLWQMGKQHQGVKLTDFEMHLVTRDYHPEYDNFPLGKLSNIAAAVTEERQTALRHFKWMEIFATYYKLDCGEPLNFIPSILECSLTSSSP